MDWEKVKVKTTRFQHNQTPKFYTKLREQNTVQVRRKSNGNKKTTQQMVLAETRQKKQQKNIVFLAKQAQKEILKDHWEKILG